MKTVPRKIISIFLVALMLSSMLPTTVFAATAPKVTAASVEKEMIAGETVDVDVVLSDNPGITGGNMKIEFEKNKLKLINVTNTNQTITSTYTGSPAMPVTNGIHGLSWDGDLLSADLTGNGVIATLTFEVLDTATVGSSTITVSNVDFVNAAADSVAGTGVNGKVTLYSKLTGDLPVAITKPVKGDTPETTISGTNYTGTIAWEGTPATFAANTAYTANVTLTAKTGYQFASDVNPTVTDATISGKSVSTDGKTLTFDAKFPKTENKTLTGITIDSAPTKTEYTVGEEFEKKGMTIKATYDDSTHAIVTDTSKFTVKPAGALTMTDTKVTVSYAEGGVTKTAEQIITVKAKALTDAMVSLDKGAYAYTGSQIQPTVTVKDGATTLKKDTDYTVAYGANNTVGTKVGTVTITGKGDYSPVPSRRSSTSPPRL